jgi:glucose-1-phosphatase
MGLGFDAQELLRRFESWPEDIYPNAVELVSRIPASYSCAVLSNTNPMHWQQIDVPGVFGGRFDRYFLSYQSGLLKPDREAFLQVTSRYACEPREVLFFDDNPLNVAAARQAGFSSVRTQGTNELEAALIDSHIIRPAD